jgi:hypothetical protein
LTFAWTSPPAGIFTVRISVVSWSEIRNSVQEKMKQSTAVAASPPRTGGRQIWRKQPKRPAPSIIAALSRSAGMSSQQCGDRQAHQRVGAREVVHL